MLKDAWVGGYVTQEICYLCSHKLLKIWQIGAKMTRLGIESSPEKVQKEVELEKLRAKAFDKMIDLAEERLNIPIRKKSGTK